MTSEQPERMVLSRWSNGESYVLNDSFEDALEQRAGYPGCEIIEMQVIRRATVTTEVKVERDE